MPLRIANIAIRSLTIVLVVELALEPRVSAFNIWRSHTKTKTVPDLTAAASSQQLNFSDNVNAKNVLVSPLTVVSVTTSPIETTAKTEAIKKNQYKSILTSTTHPTVKNATTIHYESTEVKTKALATTTVNVKSPNSTISTKSTPKAKEDKNSVNVSRQRNEADLRTTTEMNRITSYSTKPVKHIDSTTKDIVNSTSIENVTTTTESAAEFKDEDKNKSDIAIDNLKSFSDLERDQLSEDESSTTDKDEDLIKSAQSRISLEKAFSISSDIPSLEKLKSDLLSLNNGTSNTTPDANYLLPRSDSTSTNTSNISSSATEVIPSTNYLTQTSRDVIMNSGKQPRVDKMNSMRAGFLDYSSRTVPEQLGSTKNIKAVNISSSMDIVVKTTEATSTTKTTEESTSKTKTDKSMSDATHGRMAADDEIQEEFRKEDVMMNQVLKELDELNEPTSPTTTKNLRIEGGADFSSKEDNLSVKPISADKIKTTMLYTVSSNYKPMKKMEVQPPRTFARDPDDNSWRNESLSSLGIVFKANNSSKPFTQVLKNKTETEWFSLLDKYDKNDEMRELRERLEKMSEKRKSKKKKVGKDGDVIYVDYEESNSGETATKRDRYRSPEIPPLHEETPMPSPPAIDNIFKLNDSSLDLVLKKTAPTNGTKLIETFDGDDDDGDYITLPVEDIDIKKYMNPNKSTIPKTIVTSPIPPPTRKPNFPERKATVQYFPPLQKQVDINEYDDTFRDKINTFIEKTSTKNVPTPFTTSMPSIAEYGKKITTTKIPAHNPRRLVEFDRNSYQTNRAADDKVYNREASILSNLRDFMEDVVKGDDDSGGYVLPLTVSTTRSTVKPSGDYFDYDSQFRQNIIDRFMEHYNAQNEKFNVDFPVVYNSSVVHSWPDSGTMQASSNAFMRRMFDEAKSKAKVYQRSDPNCDRTVELSPAYELHYYVPEDEEKQDPN